MYLVIQYVIYVQLNIGYMYLVIQYVIYVQLNIDTSKSPGLANISRGFLHDISFEI